MRPRPASLLGVVLPIGIIITSMIVYRSMGSKSPAAPTDDRGETPTRTARVTAEQTASNVVVAKVQDYNDELTLCVNGIAVPGREVTLSAQLAGSIVYRHPHLESGLLVKQGEVLLRLDSRDCELKLADLQSQRRKIVLDQQTATNDLALTKQEIQLANGIYQLKVKEEVRLGKLLQSKSITESDFVQTREARLAAQQTVLDLTTQRNALVCQQETTAILLEQNKILIRQAELELERTRVVSPLNGRITDTTPELGAYVNKGSVLVSIEDTDEIEVACQLRSRDLVHVRASLDTAGNEAREYGIPRLPVTVTFKGSARKYSWNGTLYRAEGSGIDSKTRLLPCRVRVDRPLSQQEIPLLRGMFVSIEIHACPTNEMLSLPEQAIQADQSVWLLRNRALERKTLRQTSVHNGLAIFDARESGISAGDEVLLSGVPQPHEGLAVRGSVVETQLGTPASSLNAGRMLSLRANR